MEGELANGLIVGHAYSVTDARNVCIGFHKIFVGISIGQNMLVVKQFYNAEIITCVRDNTLNSVTYSSVGG